MDRVVLPIEISILVSAVPDKISITPTAFQLNYFFYFQYVKEQEVCTTIDRQDKDGVENQKEVWRTRL
jgi:hypothetical protein